MIIFCLILLLCGCGKYNENSFIRDYQKKIQKLKSYKLSGKLEIVNNNDVYDYDIVVSYKKNNKYKVYIKNDSNEHEQYILRNNDGVYLLTPSLNKSFKFQSDWPYNNSQIYLLNSILNDIKNDDKLKFKIKNSKYIVTCKVNYNNNKKLSYEKIVFDKRLNIQNIKIYDKDGIVRMNMKFKNIDYSPIFKDNYFDLKYIVKNSTSSTINEKKISSELDSIYPLSLPSGTKLIDEEKVKKDNGNRIIMTFDGEKSFLLVEETSDTSDNLMIIPTYGEPYRLMDTIGVMTDNSLSWSSGGIDYYLVSDVLNTNELVNIAESINILPTMK